MTYNLPPIIFCGIARNAESALQKSLDALFSISEHCERSQFIFVTNDNEDNTGKILQAWGSQKNNCTIINCDGIVDAYPERVERIAFVRNLYLSAIFENDMESFPLVCVADLDGPNTNIDPGDFYNSIDNISNWDALFANQRGNYYDIFALRHNIWCNKDCWEQVRSVKKIPIVGRLLKNRAIKKYVHSRQYFIDPATPPIEVISGFGGLAIYKRNALSNCWYGVHGGKGGTECEHVGLHRRMREKGARLFIAPGLLNDTPAEHVAPYRGKPFPREYMK